MLKAKVRVGSVVFAEVWGTVRSKSSLYLYLSCTCVGAHTPQDTCSSWFPPFTMWVLGMELIQFFRFGGKYLYLLSSPHQPWLSPPTSHLLNFFFYHMFM